jgi:hypothetical protein
MHAPSLTEIYSPMFRAPSNALIFVLGLLELVPIVVTKFLLNHAPTRDLRNSRRVQGIAVGIAKQLVAEKAEDLIAGKGKRDIMSLLGRQTYVIFGSTRHLFFQSRQMHRRIHERVLPKLKCLRRCSMWFPAIFRVGADLRAEL